MGWQFAEQPSPLTLLPSSQFSLALLEPSPHCSQGWPGNGHDQPPPCSLQAEVQPSPSTLLPSSHCSLLSLAPLPHFSQSWPETGQEELVSTAVQVALQPSPDWRLPSSQPSPAAASMKPSPHS